MRCLIQFIIFISITTICIASEHTVIIEPDYPFNQLNYENIPYNYYLQSREGIALAFSGGGVRGLAQIGVLEVFEENDIPIRFIAATSMGAIIGGLYCSGYSPAELHKLVSTTSWQRLFSPTPSRSSILVSAKGRPEKSLIKIGVEKWQPVIPKGITSGQKLSTLLTKLCYRSGIKPAISFDLLNPPFRAITTNLGSGKLEIISSGDLAEAIRASLAFPIGFTPVYINGQLLADGGLLNPMPVDICRELAGSPVIAINTTTPLMPMEDISNAFDIVNQSTTVMSLKNLEKQLALADMVITPDIGNTKTFDFINVEEIIEAGRKAALEQLPDIRKALIRKKAVNGQKFQISETRIKGLKYLPDDFFLDGLYQNEVIYESEIQNNLSIIYESGFINNARAELIEQSGKYQLNYILADNHRIHNIVFSGLTLFSPHTITKLIDSKPGQIANFKTLASDIERIEHLYTASGYTLARIDFPDIGSQSGIITFNVDEGKVNEIIIEGNKRTKKWVILRDFHIRTGKVFTADKAGRSIEDLYATGLFGTVKLTTLPCSSGVDIVIKVEEKSFDYLRAGIRYDNEYKSAGFIDLVGANIFGTGNEVSLSGQFGEKKRAFIFSIKADRIFKTYFTYRISMNYSLFERNCYIDHDYIGHLEEETTSIEFEIGQQYARLGKLSAVLNLSRHINDIPNGLKPIDKRRTSLSIRSLVDTFNSIPIPESGKLHYFDIEFANDILGGEMIYTRFYTSIEAYYPLFSGLNFHPRAELGLLNRTPPYFKLFSLGGRNSFYGLYDHELTGEKIFSGSLELRQKITGKLYTSARYDFGKVWEKLQSIRFDQLQHSFGSSLLIKTIIGPIGIVYGRTTDGNQAVYLYAGYDY